MFGWHSAIVKWRLLALHRVSSFSPGGLNTVVSQKLMYTDPEFWVFNDFYSGESVDEAI